MKADQVDQALQKKFIAEDARLVFWHDANGEFTEYLEGGLTGELSSIQVLEVAKVGGLSAKLLMEREDPTGKYLVYSQGEMPAVNEDWLLDIRTYSSEFHADMASIWLQELGMTQLHLRSHLEERKLFLGSQERRRKLAPLLAPDDDRSMLDLKMMAVLVNSPVANSFRVLSALCHGHCQGDLFDLNKEPQIMATFDKMALISDFWKRMAQDFEYRAEPPTLAGLLRKVFISELFVQTGNTHMPTISQHLLTEAGRRNSVVFLTQWRDSSVQAKSYEATASAIATEQKIDDALATLTLDSIREVDTFWQAEKQVLSRIKDNILEEQQAVDVEWVKKIVSERKSKHWISGTGSNNTDRQALKDAYEAVEAAADLFALHNQYGNSLQFETPEELLLAYQQDLYKFDQLYRIFSTRSKPATNQGWDLLKNLAEAVERVYDQGFLKPLGVEWSRLLDAGFLEKWKSPEFPSQQNFYSKYIRNHLSSSDRKRAFVIISDAFRYEAAQELSDKLNSTYRFEAKLSPMLGVLPSYTTLGMASLLPHKALAYNENGDVLVDEKLVAGTEGRSKHLASVQGMACQAKDLLKMKQNEARQFIKDHRVLYIYHNVIDARGDSSSTESETFEAVKECIDELLTLAQMCVNTLSASTVWITADHGFLFQNKSPDETDKSQLEQKPDSPWKTKKRYVIGQSLGPSPKAHHGSMQTTADAGGKGEFWIPRGTNLFHFSGGARFVHGGAMPQEAMIPLLTVSQVRGTEKESSRSEKVSVQVLGTQHKITGPVHRFEIIQTEAVGERRTSITLSIAIYEGDQEVSAIETVTFDSQSNNMADRKKSIRIRLASNTFDKNTAYRLVLRDREIDSEIQSVPVVIDRSFDNDF